MPYLQNLQDLMAASINMTIYQPTLLRDRILSPMNRRNRNYYYYRLDSTFCENDRIIQRIKISPRIFNMQLVKGYMDVVSTTGEVRRFVCSFNYNMQHFSTIVELGDKGLERLLPKHIKQYYDFKFFKNSSSCFFDVLCNYENLIPYDEKAVKNLLNKNGLDLTFLNRLNIDSTQTERGISFFSNQRPFPLTNLEDSIYNDYMGNLDKKEIDKKQKNIFSESLEDLFLGSHYVHLGSRDLLRLPPIITPSMGALFTLLPDLQHLKIKKIYHSRLADNLIDKDDEQNSCREFYNQLEKSGIPIEDVQQAGKTIHFDNINLRILSVQNPEFEMNAYNNSSMVMRVCDKQTSILFLGDAGVECGEKLLQGPYGRELDSDYVQMAHHGQQGCSREFYQSIKFRGCLWSTPLWVWNNDAGQGFNTSRLKTVETRHWMDELGIKEHHVTCLEGMWRLN